MENQKLNAREKMAGTLARVGFLMLILATAALVSSCARSEKAATQADPAMGPTVGVVRVTRKDLSRDLVISAEFRPFQEIDVHAKVAGYVKEIYVDVGDHVKQGQLLAVLEIPELRDEVSQATAAVKQSEEEIARAQDELDRSQSAHEVSHLAYQRLMGVSKTQPNLIAQQDIDDAMGRDRVSEAQVAAAKAALAASQQQLEVSKANEKRLETLFGYARITAPFTGVVTWRYADTGALIQAGTNSQTQSMPVVKLSQNDLLRLSIPVPESAVPQVHLGGLVEVQVPVLNKTFEGKVARFADKLDLSTRTMETEVDVPNPSLQLVPGMYANASLVLDQARGVLAIPIQALNRTEGKVTVDRVNSLDEIEEVPVKLGLETPDHVEILSGLQENDQVVVSGRTQLRNGEKVSPKFIELPTVKGIS